MNLSFISDIIKSQADGYREEFLEGLLTEDECAIRIQVLDVLRFTIKQFIDDANALSEAERKRYP